MAWVAGLWDGLLLGWLRWEVKMWSLSGKDRLVVLGFLFTLKMKKTDSMIQMYGGKGLEDVFLSGLLVNAG